LKVCLSSLDGPGDNPGAGKLFEFPLNGPGSKADHVDDLALIEALAGMRKERSKHGLTRCSE
jgi:hypothetical protein